MGDKISPVALVLEDDGLIALDLEGTLQDAGFEVFSFASCKETEPWLQAHAPDLAVLDMHLVDGGCEHIAEMLVSRRIPFVVHSGEIEADYRDTVFSKGKWLSKPSHAAELAALARSLASTS